MSFYSVRRGKREMIEDLPEEHVTADHIGHSTLEYTTPDGRRVIRFHRTNVVTFHPNGDVELNTDGHQSNTTKKRFNEHLPRRVGVYQHRHEWFVQTPVGTYPFFDGFTIKQNSVPTEETYARLIHDDDLSILDLFELEAKHDVDAIRVLAIAVHGGGVTQEELDALPEDVLVDLDVELEKLQ